VIGIGTKDTPKETEGDDVVWGKKEYALMRDATQDIIDDGDYYYYGLRVQETDTEKIGEQIEHLSKNFGGDFGDLSGESEELNGVSTIGVDDIRQMYSNGGYEGRVIYLVGSDEYDIGYDPGEKIMKEPVVLAKGKIENGELKIIEKVEISDDNQVVENTAEKAIENVAGNAAMKEYEEFKDKIIKKYGEENMWSQMTDEEMEKWERLERMAYKGY
jgi:hypothetical protein